MVKPVTEKFEELVIEAEFDPIGAPGVYTKICGMIDATVNRTANVDTSEVPEDCDDESLPLSIEKQVRSIDVSISGTGVWAAQSQGLLKSWFYSTQPLNVKVTDAAALTGDIEVEQGPALLVNFPTDRAKGRKVNAEIELNFDGTPARALAA